MHRNRSFWEGVPRFTRLSKGAVARKDFKNPWWRRWLHTSTPHVTLLSLVKTLASHFDTPRQPVVQPRFAWIASDTGTCFSEGLSVFPASRSVVGLSINWPSRTLSHPRDLTLGCSPCLLFKDGASSWTVGWLLNNGLGRMWQMAAVASFYALPRHLWGYTAASGR